MKLPTMTSSITLTESAKAIALIFTILERLHNDYTVKKIIRCIAAAYGLQVAP